MQGTAHTEAVFHCNRLVVPNHISHPPDPLYPLQFEVLAKLTDLWKSRIDGCPEAPTLEYSNVVQGPNGPEYVFRLISGTVDVPAFDRDWAFYDKLLVLDSSESTNNGTDPGALPVEALFDDLGVSGLVFPLNRWTKANWGQQHPRVQRELVVADVRNVYTDKNAASTMVALAHMGKLANDAHTWLNFPSVAAFGRF